MKNKPHGLFFCFAYGKMFIKTSVRRNLNEGKVHGAQESREI